MKPTSHIASNQLQPQSGHTFSAKEKDDETGYSYFGARYYDSDLSVWLSVDPLASKYPSLSPYNYCGNNPIMMIDPNGMEFGKPGDVDQQNKDKKIAATLRGYAQSQYNKFIESSHSYQDRIDNLDKNKKSYSRRLERLTMKQEEATNGALAMQSLIEDIDNADKSEKWFTFCPTNPSETNGGGLTAEKDENGNIIYQIGYSKGNGLGIVFHELSHAGEVAIGTAEAIFDGNKLIEMKLLKGNKQFYSEFGAYRKQYFIDPLSMPNGPINNSSQITKSYLQQIKNDKGKIMYPDIK